MSTPNPILIAAKPAILASLEAVIAFIHNLGTDPAQIAVKLPGAISVLVGTIEMQLPGLAAGELGAVQEAVTAKINDLIAKVNAQTAEPPK